MTASAPSSSAATTGPPPGPSTPPGRNPYATIPGGARQRTLAYRFGVNLVMYALTGNYKGDQVHVPGHPGAARPMKLEQAYAALRFEPAVPWLGARRCSPRSAPLVLLPAAAPARPRRGLARPGLRRAARLARRPAPGAGDPRRAARYRPLRRRQDRLHERRRPRHAPRRRRTRRCRSRPPRMPDLEMRTVEVPEGGHDGTHLFAAIEPRPRRHPALPPGRHRRADRWPGARRARRARCPRRCTC